ncbi:DedA family protein [Thalassobaculum sp.]|uniref:DedA family protein n=1 Tax=Thalassobaculum sp. TaxID=2022740 RepID=UPI0032EFE000
MPADEPQIGIPVLDALTNWAAQGGYPAVAALMFLENVFPPIPSEVVMPLAGFAASRGEMSLPLAILSGSAGSLAGAWLWYGIGRTIGVERLAGWAGRHGRWLTVSSGDVKRSAGWFHRHGGKVVLVGRLVPALRTLISVPAGVARMPTGRFLLYSGIGTVIWTGFLAGVGFTLGSQHAVVAAWADPIAKLIVGALFLAYLWRVITFKPDPDQPAR